MTYFMFQEQNVIKLCLEEQEKPLWNSLAIAIGSNETTK